MNTWEEIEANLQSKAVVLFENGDKVRLEAMTPDVFARRAEKNKWGKMCYRVKAAINRNGKIIKCTVALTDSMALQAVTLRLFDNTEDAPGWGKKAGIRKDGKVYFEVIS